MCKVWGVATRKGGVGKTTTSTTMAYLLAKAGYKVALIDFDGQRHSTKLSGVMLPEKLPITIYEILSSLVMGEELPEIETYIIHTESGVDLIPANNRLDYFDKLMCNTDFAEYYMKDLMMKEQQKQQGMPMPVQPGSLFSEKFMRRGVKTESEED